MGIETNTFNKDLSVQKGRLYTGLSTHIQDANISFLRQYFKSMKPNGYDTSSYSPDIGSTSITVEGEFPRRHVKYPLVVVSTINGGELMQRLIGRELYTPIYSKKSDGTRFVSGYSMAGVFTSNFSISIASESTAERRDLLDLIVMLYRTVGSEYLKKFRVNITNIRYGSGKTEFLANDLVYFDTLNFTVQTEWKQVIQNVPLITSIDVETIEVEEEPIF